jgi:hypothetical protein
MPSPAITSRFRFGLRFNIFDLRSVSSFRSGAHRLAGQEDTSQRKRSCGQSIQAMILGDYHQAFYRAIGLDASGPPGVIGCSGFPGFPGFSGFPGLPGRAGCAGCAGCAGLAPLFPAPAFSREKTTSAVANIQQRISVEIAARLLEIDKKAPQSDCCSGRSNSLFEALDPCRHRLLNRGARGAIARARGSHDRPNYCFQHRGSEYPNGAATRARPTGSRQLKVRLFTQLPPHGPTGASPKRGTSGAAGRGACRTS